MSSPRPISHLTRIGADVSRLFEDIERTLHGPASYSLPKWEFLNRSSRRSVEVIRRELESWYANYPGQYKAELRRRFESKRADGFRSAFQELFLHELLVRLGCIVTVQPVLSDRATRPDLLAVDRTGASCYLEAIATTESADKDQGARRRRDVFFDVLNERIKSSEFWVGVDVEGTPGKPPPARNIARYLTLQLKKLDPDIVQRNFEQSGSYSSGPRWRFECDGWILTFFPIPKSLEARGDDSGQALGWFVLLAEILTAFRFEITG